MMENVSSAEQWEPTDPGLVKWIADHRQRALGAYRSNPVLVGEHGRQEDSFRTGGYANRQILELVQNAGDALRRSGRRGRVELHLRGGALYCANEGAPFSEEGLTAVCHAYLSDKRGDEMGRFGLGFKSVLGVTDTPMILSRSVSFGFDAVQSKRELSEIAPAAHMYPVLRLPTVVDAVAEVGKDPVLSELGQWAQTIVRLPLVGDAGRLVKDLEQFPREFLLFAPFVETLGIRLHDDDDILEFRCEDQGDHRYRLIDAADASSEWMVWQQSHRPTAEALAEVGQAIGRPEVTVTYAAPLDTTRELGRFWAFFPLADSTSTRGIHNAPWHINDDRTNLQPGKFNDELLEVVTDLVVAALPHLSTPADPARHFDYLPARGRETDNFADRRLTSTIPDRASQTPCIPDMDGVLRAPDALQYANFDLRLDLESFRLWSDAPDRPVDFPHWSCYQGATRQARLRRLVRGDADRAIPRELGASRWLEHVVEAGSDQSCAAALRVAMSVSDEATFRDMETAAVIPDSVGNLSRLDESSHVFLKGTPLSASAGIRLVRSSFLELPLVQEWLRGRGFRDVDPTEELRTLASTATLRWGTAEWSAFWGVVKEVAPKDADEILVAHVKKGLALQVLARDGQWHAVGTVVVAGEVAPLDDALVLDDAFHRPHLQVLRVIGVVAEPAITEVAGQDLALLDYRRLQRAAYLADLPARGRPEPQTLSFVEERGPAPLHMLRLFADSADESSRVTWSRKLLSLDAPDQWTLRQGQGSKFPSKTVLAPHLWAVETYGLVDTTWGPREARRALHPELQDLGRLLPVATWRTAAKIPGLARRESMSVDLWREFLHRLPSGGAPGELGELLLEAWRRLPVGEVPLALPAVRGDGYDSVPPGELMLAASNDEATALREQHLPFVTFTDIESAASICEAWGCLPASSKLSVDIVAENPSEAVVLLDRFRRLKDHGAARLDLVELIACSTVERVVTLPDGTASTPEVFAVSGRTIYFDANLDEERLLELISSHYGLDLDSSAISRVLHEADTERIETAKALCRSERNPPAKLRALLPSSVLEAKVPAGLIATVATMPGPSETVDVAELLIHIHGYDVLKHLRRELETFGYSVPERWAGSPPAIAFVRSLGFAAEFAGERGSRREPEEVVQGPPNLKPLHDYQEVLASQIRDLAKPSQSPRRAMLYLPTGAGKTRVTVEALVRSMVARDFSEPVLWIAQSDELCEQGVQTWMEVWRQFGDRPLRVGRLWKGNQLGASDIDASVIVATDAELAVVREKDEYEWLRQPAIIVLDEAHGATGTDITATLRWLGIEQRSTARPFLGLTATPFKGRGEKANQSLAARFGGTVLNALGDDPYDELRRLEVLARVEHAVLPGSAYVLDDPEKKNFAEFKDIPKTVLARIGQDRARTVRLMEDIARRPPAWPILVFTSSVLSAQILSVLLRVNGISSAAVSGATPMLERRRAIEDFRRGDVRVLTNCDVLTQGFDAPKVRALYIARPTFSPNAYIQMVGRGLRGPANGGEPECLVVNVADTFNVFGEQLAYNEFDYLWNVQGGGSN
ncbi:DEAD/DEAH box helicase [Cellulomonas sp. Leaf334]|uniref:DEAD/DEAH box helicase n=1 Tax=Cellulomonas sp. Leaf334 TaxID=1736339 RepID=UPI0007015B54|nr:DEAD/DEAH box helicase [Cellulomonas sp. Leaf334]KQR10441.1 hypothetical protein ASF78_17290 [Cellulomonas sp. Leaf334]